MRILFVKKWIEPIKWLALCERDCGFYFPGFVFCCVWIFTGVVIFKAIFEIFCEACIKAGRIRY